MKKYRFNYNAKDSANIFFWLLVGNLVFSFFFIALLSQIATSKGMTFEQYTETEAFVYLNMMLTQLVYSCIFLVYNLICKIKFVPATRIKTRLNWKIVLICVGLGLICLFGSNYFVGLFDFIIEKLFGIKAQGLEVSNNIWSFLLCTVFVALLPSIFEEIIFRGMMFNGFKSKLKLSHAILLSALFFALMHMSISQFVYQFALGILFALIVHITGSTVYAMIAHFTNNFTVLLISFIDSDVFVNTSWGFWEVFGAIAILLGAISLIIVILKMMQKYCKKHKTAAYSVTEKLSIEEQLEKAEGLTPYEIKQLSEQKLSDKATIVISLLCGIAMWLFSILG